MTKELKDAHVQSIIYALKDAQAVIRSEPDLWYGGLPTTLHAIDNFVDGQIHQLTSIFEVENKERPLE